MVFLPAVGLVDLGLTTCPYSNSKTIKPMTLLPNIVQQYGLPSGVPPLWFS